MVVLRLGGVYADVDTECKKPLDDIILPKDTLVVSWENEFSTAEEARQRRYVRKRQVPFSFFTSSYSLHNPSFSKPFSITRPESTIKELPPDPS